MQSQNNQRQEWDSEQTHNVMRSAHGEDKLLIEIVVKLNCYFYYTPDKFMVYHTYTRRTRDTICATHTTQHCGISRNLKFLRAAAKRYSY